MAARPPRPPPAALPPAPTTAVPGAAGRAGAMPGHPAHAPGGRADIAATGRDSARGARRHASAALLPGASRRARVGYGKVGGMSCGRFIEQAIPAA